MVLFIIFCNFLIYTLWLFSPEFEYLTFMTQNFLVSFIHLEEGFYWVLLTSVFSHNLFLHFAVNMLVLYSFGKVLSFVLGPWHMLKFYLVAGVISSLCHALVSKFFIGDPALPALGASGAIAGLVAVFSFLFPRQKLLIFGLIPIPAFTGILLFIGLDLWGLLAQVKGGGLPIGHGAHLGGAFTGIAYYYIYLKPRISSDAF